MSNGDLTPEERAVIGGLPREGATSALLEERVVRALREEGLLRARGPWGLPAQTARWAAAAACLLAMLTGAYAVGHRAGEREALRIAAQLHGQASTEAVAMVRQAGEAYLAALQRLSRQSAAAAAGEREQGRQEAVRSLHAAASEMVTIDPNDQVSGYILQAFDRAGEGLAATATDSLRIVWF
jgi:hypothetical protein